MLTAKRIGIPGRQARALALKALTAFLLCVAFSSGASAQLNSNVGPVVLNANLASSLSVVATPSLVNFNLVFSGVSNGSSPITVTTTWSLNTIISQVSLYAYFAAPTTAMSNALGARIPTANVSGSVNGGGYAAFAGASPYAGATGITMFQQFVLGFNIIQTRTDTLNLRINTTGLPLSPGLYTGTLFIQAQAL